MCLLLLLATTAAAAAVLLLDAAQLFAQGLAQVGLHLVVAPHDEEEEDGRGEHGHEYAVDLVVAVACERRLVVVRHVWRRCRSGRSSSRSNDQVGRRWWRWQWLWRLRSWWKWRQLWSRSRRSRRRMRREAIEWIVIVVLVVVFATSARCRRAALVVCNAE